ncbi:hypothetical protein N7507_002516 [Penicillium longicatenatum]|nr:hypothetical protein N7507_002516 [Penicillium longicatenatum]
MLDPSDAPKVCIPMALSASMDEPVSDVKEFESALAVPHVVETFPDQIHGWMAARSDLQNEKVRQKYQRGYSIILDFLRKHL